MSNLKMKKKTHIFPFALHLEISFDIHLLPNPLFFLFIFKTSHKPVRCAKNLLKIKSKEIFAISIFMLNMY
jgi:hypothetical protein